MFFRSMGNAPRKRLTPVGAIRAHCENCNEHYPRRCDMDAEETLLARMQLLDDVFPWLRERDRRKSEHRS